jgi:hypothetical protein
MDRMRRIAAVLGVLGSLVGGGGALALADVQGDEVALDPAVAEVGTGLVYDLAYNPRGDRYLAAWLGGPDLDGLEARVRVVAPGGGASGTVATAGSGSAGALDGLRVAADTTSGGWLAVWTSPQDGREIRGRRLDASGAPVGGELRISTTGTDTDELNANFPAVAYDPDTDGFLVAWAGEVSNTETEVFARRVTAQGALSGTQQRLTTTGTRDDDGLRAYSPQLAYDAASRRFLLAFYRNHDVGVGDDLNLDVYTQLVTPAGAASGGATRVTTTGADTDDRGASSPAVVWDPAGGFLLAYQSDGPPLANNEQEIFTQRLNAAGEADGAPQPVSSTPGSANAINPSLALGGAGPTAQALLVFDRYFPTSESMGQVLTRLGTPVGTAFALGGTARTLGARAAGRTAGGAGVEWLAGYGSYCRAQPRFHAEPFVRQVTAAAASGTATCPRPGAGPGPTATPTPAASSAPAATATAEPTPIAALPTVAPPPPPPAPPAATATPVPAALKASAVVSLPSAKRCVSRRRFTIRLKRPAGATLASAVVTVNGKPVKTVTGRRLTAPVDLRGLPKGKVKVSVTARTTDGRSVTETRTYRTCAPKRR